MNNPFCKWPAPALWMIATLALAGCSGPEKTVKVVAVVHSVIEDPLKKAIIVTAANSGASIVLEPAQELIVRLELDVTSVGDWTLTDREPSLFTVIGPRLDRETRGMTGDVDLAISSWRFKPTAAGQLALTFELKRPHSLAPALSTVIYDVTVK